MEDPDTSRLEAFADAVMAIAITLLILEIHVPDVGPGESLGRALADQWSSYAAYVVSFMTIGIMWVNHHHMFRLIRISDHIFLVLNVIFLMTISFLPWPTALLARYIRDPDQVTTATMVYGGTMVMIAIMFNVVWLYASRGQRLLVAEADAAMVETINHSYHLGPMIYLVATLLALINPWISLSLFAAFAIFYTLPVSGPRAERIVAKKAGTDSPPGGD